MHYQEDMQRSIVRHSTLMERNNLALPCIALHCLAWMNHGLLFTVNLTRKVWLGRPWSEGAGDVLACSYNNISSSLDGSKSTDSCSSFSVCSLAVDSADPVWTSLRFGGTAQVRSGGLDSHLHELIKSMRYQGKLFGWLWIGRLWRYNEG